MVNLGFKAAATNLATAGRYGRSRIFSHPRYRKWVLLSTAGAALVGVVLGIVSSILGYALPFIGFGAITVLTTFLIGLSVPVGLLLIFILSCIYFARAWLWATYGLRPPIGNGDLYGSARFAERADIAASERLKLNNPGEKVANAIIIGNTSAGPLETIHYSGDRHLLTVAPTRAGKTRGAVIPNAINFAGSLLVIDPKGEVRAAVLEGRAGEPGIAIAFAPFGRGSGRRTYNPLDLLKPDSPTFAADATMLSDAIVYPVGGGEEVFWTQEAQAFFATVLMFVALGEPEEDGSQVMETIGTRYGKRNLGRARELVTLAPEHFSKFLRAMYKCPHELVSRGAARHMQKSDREGAGVISSVQSQTHFLDVPSIEASLEKTTFSFRTMQETPASVFIELPPQYLQPLHRYVRLLVTSALRELILRPDAAPPPPPGTAGAKIPVLFILDEFASLGRLAPIEEAYALMAGYGVQLWAICQDLSQLQALYRERYQTFIANAGVFQVFGSRDLMTAEYASRIAGTSTRRNGFTNSLSAARAYMVQWWYPPRMADYLLQNHFQLVQRPLVFADEVLTMSYRHMLLFVEQTFPIMGEKLFVPVEPRRPEPDPEEPPTWLRDPLFPIAVCLGTLVAIFITLFVGGLVESFLGLFSSGQPSPYGNPYQQPRIR